MIINPCLSVPTSIQWATALFLREGSLNRSKWIGVFAWNPDDETPGDLLSRMSQVGRVQLWEFDRPEYSVGRSYEMVLAFSNHTLLDIPESFDLPALIDADDAVVYDTHNYAIVSKAHPLISGRFVVRPSEGKISDQGRWLSQADQYSKGPDGETEGPSGLVFL
jgi:hypothetical protein